MQEFHNHFLNFLVNYSQEMGEGYTSKRIDEFPSECFETIPESYWLTIFKKENVSELTKTHLWKGLERKGGDIFNIAIPNLLPVSYTLIDAILNSGDFKLSTSFIRLLSEPRFVKHYRQSTDRLCSLTKSLLCSESRFGTTDKMEIFTCLFEILPKEKEVQHAVLKEILCSHLFLSKPRDFLFNALWNNWDFSCKLPMTNSLKEKLVTNPLLKEYSQVPAWVFVLEPSLIWENLGEQKWHINEKIDNKKDLTWGTVVLYDALTHLKDNELIRYLEVLNILKYDFSSNMDGMKAVDFIKKNKKLDYDSIEMLFFKKISNELEIREKLNSKPHMSKNSINRF